MKYIPISEIEKIINSNKLENLYNEYKNYGQKYSLIDYISNIESYIYAYLMLNIKNEEIAYITNIIEKYIDGIILPLAKKNPLIFIKSKICKIIIKIYNEIEVEINKKCAKYIKEFPHSNLYMSFTSNKKNIKNTIKTSKSTLLLQSYIEITKDTKYLFEIYFNIPEIRQNILNSELKSYFIIDKLPKRFIYEENIFLEILNIEENIKYINKIDLKNTKEKEKIFIKERLKNLKDKNKIILLKNKKFISNNTYLFVNLISTISNKMIININELPNHKNLDYEEYRQMYSYFNKEEIIDQLHKNIEKKNISGANGLFIYLNIEKALNTLEKIYINKNLIVEYASKLSKQELTEFISDIRLINYLKKYNYIILISKLEINESEKTQLINNKQFKNKYKINKIKEFNTYFNEIIKEITYRLMKKANNISLIDTICFYKKFNDFYLIQNNIYQIIETLYSRKYINFNIDNETSKVLLKEFLKLIDPTIKIKICRNKQFENGIVTTKYNKNTKKRILLINKICIKNENFFNKLTLSLIVNEIKNTKSINEKNTNKIQLIIETKRTLILKKINHNYLDYNNNFIRTLISNEEIPFKYKNLSGNKIDVLFKKIYTKYEIKELLKKYPILSLEYETDGEEKNIISLIYDKHEIKLMIKRKIKDEKAIYDLKADLNAYEYLITKKTYLDINQITDEKIDKIIREIEEIMNFDYKNIELNKEKTKICKIIINKHLLQLKNNNLDIYYNKIINSLDKKICNIK